MTRRLYHIAAALLLLCTLWSCSSTRHVPPGHMLLDKVSITVQADTTNIDTHLLLNYLRQTPNNVSLGFAKTQLGIYNLSGRDSSKWYNRWIRRMGQPPVVYDHTLTDASVRQLQQALINQGHMHASVTADTLSHKRKMRVQYNLKPGTPHTIRSIKLDAADTTIRQIILQNNAPSMMKPGDLLDRNALEQQRVAMTDLLRNRGYYTFTKEQIGYIADTLPGQNHVDITMVVRPSTAIREHTLLNTVANQYIIQSVKFIVDGTSRIWQSDIDMPACDSIRFRNIDVVYTTLDHYLLPSSLEEKCFLRPGQKYSTAMVDRTYESLSQLGIIRTINIQMQPLPTLPDGTGQLQAVIVITRNKKQNASIEFEGTNSEGDFGFGLGLGYVARNLGRRSNLLSAKLRINYESLSGNLSDLINDRYTEYAAETAITFPKLLCPFLSTRFKLRSKASTQLAVQFNHQQRPEYTRIIAGASWRYKWGARDNRTRRVYDLIDVNYVYLPKKTDGFINTIAPNNPLLRYSYEDHFIVSTGYSYYLTNRTIASSDPWRKSRLQSNIFTLRASVQTAGNLLYAISSISGQKRHKGVYELFGIQYSQYAKAEIDYSRTHNYTTRHSLAWHIGAGIGVPYGNSRALPFEKRFYAGGANSVRGWGVRTLGPGSFDSRNSVTSFINQCGDIRLDLSAEYRAKLFWVFEGAFFIDAGNIWTIHSYPNQPGGMWRITSFWKQIACSYGVGIRMDFNYFLLRLDLGIKAHNPARTQERWPIIHPRWKRDTALHFAVGYPF